MTLPPGSHRGGVMTQASVLKVTADGTRTSPVLRGKWVLERIVGKPPAPPPPDIPLFEPDIRGATTIREQLDKHRNTPACATCHNHIDPPGFALENFDPIGGWRDFYRAPKQTKKGVVKGTRYFRGPDVEVGGVTPDGRAFKNIDDYKKILLEDKDQLARNLTAKLLIYATGADIQFADREVVEQIVATLRAKNYGFRELIHEVVQSRVFLNIVALERLEHADRNLGGVGDLAQRHTAALASVAKPSAKAAGRAIRSHDRRANQLMLGSGLRACQTASGRVQQSGEAATARQLPPAWRHPAP